MPTGKAILFAISTTVVSGLIFFAGTGTPISAAEITGIAKVCAVIFVLMFVFFKYGDKLKF